MAVAFDATFLMLMLDPRAKGPVDPQTGSAIADAEARIEFLIQTMEKSRRKIVIPTPALSEVLVGADAAGPDYLSIISQHSCFEVAGFDVRAAVEVAAVTRQSIDDGDKKSGSTAPWQKVKYDRQIVGIAKVNGASIIYTDDQGIAKFANHAGMEVVGIADLPLPSEDPQQSLDLD